jgi:hypothetical protein
VFNYNGLKKEDFFFEGGGMSKRVMEKLHRKGFLKNGFLPHRRKKETNDMVAMLKEPVFRELLLVLKTKKAQDNQTRVELIKSIEDYIKHPEIISPEYDLLMRAKVEGNLLESVLRLLMRDRFDPVGCIILAQQDRELNVDYDQMSPLSQVDLN